MAIGTTLAIIAGVSLLVGGSAIAGTWFATEDDRARARIEEINEELKNCDEIINYFQKIKDTSQESKNYLSNAKTDFTNGGHVLDGVPLANAELKTCISKLEDAVNSSGNIINRYNNIKSELEKEKRELQAKLD